MGPRTATRSFLVICTIFLLVSAASRGFAAEREGLYVGAAILGQAGTGPIHGHRVAGFAYDPSSGTDVEALPSVGAGLDLAVGWGVRRNLALALDVSVLAAVTTNSPHDTSPDLSTSGFTSERALALGDWFFARSFDLRGGVGAETTSFTQRENLSNVFTVPCATCSPVDTRTADRVWGPAFLLGAGYVGGKPGALGVSVGVDLGIAYLGGSVASYVPLTATLRIGLTSF